MSERIDNTEDYKIASTSKGSNSPGGGYCISNTTPTTQITNFTVTFYLPDSGLAFDAAGYDSGRWTVLSRATSVPSRSYNGRTYYAYSTAFVGTLPATAGTTCAPAFAFESQGDDVQTGYYYVNNSATVDGKTLVVNAGPVTMN